MALTENLTPTEELMVEVLVARVRTGESLWTFHKKFANTAKTLATKGYVLWKSGVVDNTILVWFTGEAKKELVEDTKWELPILKEYIRKDSIQVVPVESTTPVENVKPITVKPEKVTKSVKKAKDSKLKKAVSKKTDKKHKKSKDKKKK